MLNLHLRIKFRVLFTDVGYLDRTVSVPFAMQLPDEVRQVLARAIEGMKGRVLINERGVLLEIV